MPFKLINEKKDNTNTRLIKEEIFKFTICKICNHMVFYDKGHNYFCPNYKYNEFF